MPIRWKDNNVVRNTTNDANDPSKEEVLQIFFSQKWIFDIVWHERWRSISCSVPVGNWHICFILYHIAPTYSTLHILHRHLANSDIETYIYKRFVHKKIVDIYTIVETILLNILKLENDENISEIKQILFATNIKTAFILKNSLKVIIRQVCSLRGSLYFVGLYIKILYENYRSKATSELYSLIFIDDANDANKFIYYKNNDIFAVMAR